MELRVKNITDGEVSVLWDGLENVFKPGEVKIYDHGVAEHIVSREPQSLSIITDEMLVEKVVEKVEVPTEPKVEEVVTKPKRKYNRKK